MNVMSTVNTLLKNVNKITFFYQLYVYSSVILPTVFVIVLITTIYLKYFHNRRLRWIHFSIMIPLEPELRYFVSTITEFVRDYNLNAQDLFTNYYNDAIKENLFFYKTINDGAIQSRFDEAMNELGKLNVTFDNTGNNDSMDTFMNDVEKFLYTRFSWSKAEKFNRTESNVAIVNNFYDKLKLIVDQENVFNTFMNNSSLITFVDLDHMETDERSVLNNSLFKTYGKYLPNGNLNSYITDIMTERNTPNAYNTKRLESVMLSNQSFFNTQSSKTIDEEIVETLAQMTNRVRNVFAEYYNTIIQERDGDDVTNTGSDESKCRITTEDGSNFNGLIDADIPNNLVFPDDEAQQSDYIRRLSIYETLNAMSTYYEEHKEDVENMKEYFLNKYIFVEKTIYEEFDAKTHFPLFNSQTAQAVLNDYHTVMDHVNVKTSIETIELATRFTIYYLLDEDQRKEENLEQLVSLYIGFNDLFVLERDFRKKLDAYNKSRKPEIDELKKLYNRRLSEYKTFFIEDGISKQWSELYKGKIPPRYYWTLDWLRKILGKKSFDDIIKWLFNEHKDGTSSEDINRRTQMEVDAHFNSDLQYMSETGELQSMINEQSSGGGVDEAEAGGDVVEGFESNEKKVVEHFGFFGGIANPFKELGSIIGEIFKFLKMAMKILIKLIKLITKPTEFLVFFVKMIVAFFMIFFKLVWYLVKLHGSKDGVYLIGEFLAYNIVLVFTTIFNFSWFKVLFVFTYIIMVLDLSVFKGSLYSFLYWLFGATENSPRAWYLRAGHHYGQDTCKSETCDNHFQNKAKRMFFAFNACGDNYKPDRDSAGIMCARKLSQEPGFCLNANIERVRQGLPVKTPIVPGEFLPNQEFLDATKMKRRRMINDFKKMKTNFYNNCENTMNPYNDLTKNVCRMYAGVVATDRERRKLEALCYNTYCSNGRREQFCYKYTKPNSQDLISKQPGKGGAVMYKSVVVGSLYILIVSYLVNQMLHSIPTVPSLPTSS